MPEISHPSLFLAATSVFSEAKMFRIKSLVLSSSSLEIRSSQSRWDTQSLRHVKPRPRHSPAFPSGFLPVGCARADRHSKRCFSHRPWPKPTWPLFCCHLQHWGKNLPLLDHEEWIHLPLLPAFKRQRPIRFYFLQWSGGLFGYSGLKEQLRVKQNPNFEQMKDMMDSK